MIKIGITGSIASGKTTVSKYVSKKRGPLFSADKVVKNLYKNKVLNKFIAKKLKFKFNSKFKKNLKKKILDNILNLNKLEKIIHPLVKKEMFKFLKDNKKKKILFFEIPLMIEGKFNRYFDQIIFVKSDRKLRLKRYKMNGGSETIFSLLDNNQLKDSKKMKFCKYIVVNNNSLSVLKKKLLNIIKEYE